jgi:hypothetical protein
MSGFLLLENLTFLFKLNEMGNMSHYMVLGFHDDGWAVSVRSDREDNEGAAYFGKLRTQNTPKSRLSEDLFLRGSCESLGAAVSHRLLNKPVQVVMYVNKQYTTEEDPHIYAAVLTETGCARIRFKKRDNTSSSRSSNKTSNSVSVTSPKDLQGTVALAANDYALAALIVEEKTLPSKI